MMRTIFDPRDRDRLLERLRRVRPDSPRRWGTMSAHQMVCHQADAFRMALGERPVAPFGGRVHRTILKWGALYAPTRWPRGFPAPRALDQEVGGTPPEAFERDLAELERLIDRFAAAPADFEWGAHAIFGPLSHRQWGRWGYLHADHHLRQFGV